MKPQLFFWFMRRLAPATSIASPVAIVWALLVFGPLYRQNGFALFFIITHCVAITCLLSRFSSGFAWLHGRGYTRKTIWSHTMAAAAASALFVWLPAALIVLTPLRSLLHDRVFQEPYYPIMQPRDAREVWIWLWAYALLIPLMSYGWIREAQPTRGSTHGWSLVIVAMLAGFSLYNITRPDSPFWLPMNAVFAAVALICLFTGRALYRTLEIRR